MTPPPLPVASPGFGARRGMKESKMKEYKGDTQNIMKFMQ